MQVSASSICLSGTLQSHQLLWVILAGGGGKRGGGFPMDLELPMQLCRSRLAMPVCVA